MKLRQAKKILNNESKFIKNYRDRTFNRASKRVSYKTYKQFFGQLLKNLPLR